MANCVRPLRGDVNGQLSGASVGWRGETAWRADGVYLAGAPQPQPPGAAVTIRKANHEHASLVTHVPTASKIFRPGGYLLAGALPHPLRMRDAGGGLPLFCVRVGGCFHGVRFSIRLLRVRM